MGRQGGVYFSGRGCWIDRTSNDSHQNIHQLTCQTIKWMKLLSTEPGYRPQSKCWDLFRQITPITRPERQLGSIKRTRILRLLAGNHSHRSRPLLAFLPLRPKSGFHFTFIESLSPWWSESVRRTERNWSVGFIQTQIFVTEYSSS